MRSSWVSEAGAGVGGGTVGGAVTLGLSVMTTELFEISHSLFRVSRGALRWKRWDFGFFRVAPPCNKRINGNSGLVGPIKGSELGLVPVAPSIRSNLVGGAI